jgi:4-diphosphocytidyl-2-C-methyl-D-erythritol kinase
MRKRDKILDRRIFAISGARRVQIMRSIRVTTPAKINLFLRVLGARPDGYHDIETLFQAIGLYDELMIEETTGESCLVVPGRPDLETEANLVMRAVRWIEKKTGQRLPVKVQLTKRIPVAAGLGGGSSDAAATLVGIRSLFALDLGDDDLRQGAVALGADVPFFLRGGSAVGEGIGERLTPVNLPMNYSVLLVCPAFSVSTEVIFREFSKILTGEGREGRLWPRLQQAARVEDLLHNDLQSVTESMHPELARISQSIHDAGLEATLMSGSGPTLFGITEPDEVENIKRRLPRDLNIVVARPVRRGIVLH